MSDSSHVSAVILAGGSGTRFWPLSRELTPKQLLSVFGQETLIEQAIARAEAAIPCNDICVVAGGRLSEELRNHLSGGRAGCVREIRYITEPAARNTAPAIALAAATLLRDDPDAVMVVLPSDHLMDSGELWVDCVSSAVALAREGYLVTVGIRPTRPETGYGYIQAGEPLGDFAVGSAVPRRAARFVEKPDLALAREYLASGEYSWNAGVFVMRADRVLEELEAHGDTSQIAVAAREIASGTQASDSFADLPSISIDYAVMERAQKVAMIPADLDWSDVGSLVALERIAPADADGNVRSGRGVDIDTTGTVIYSTDRLVATLGISDALVVDTADATLVASKDRAQDVRLIVEALRAQGAPEVVESLVGVRPWGLWTSLLKGPGYHIKSIEVRPGARLSLQRHAHRSEHWVVVCGSATVTVDGNESVVNVNESTYIPVGAVHRLENQGVEVLRIIEVQVGDYIGEDDIERLDDDWNRGS